MSKQRKRLVQDIQVEDIILLERPEFEVLKIDKPSSLFRQAPKGKVFIGKDKATGQVSMSFFLDEEKVDTLPRKTVLSRMWDWFGKKLDKKHEEHKIKVDLSALPFAGKAPKKD